MAEEGKVSFSGTALNRQKCAPWERYEKREDQEFFLRLLEEGLSNEQVIEQLALLGIRQSDTLIVTYGLHMSHPVLLAKIIL